MRSAQQQQQSDFERLATYCLFLQPYLTLWGVKRFSFFIVLTLGCPLALCCLKVLSALCMAQQGIYLISFEGLILRFDGILWHSYQVILFLQMEIYLCKVSYINHPYSFFLWLYGLSYGCRFNSRSTLIEASSGFEVPWSN